MTDRAINTAIVIKYGNRTTEDVSVLLNRENGFKVREQYNLGEIDFECCECKQSLIISYRYSVYLKHKPNSKECALKDENTAQELIDDINRSNLSKESPRHLELKHKLIEKLQNNGGITELESEQYISNGKERRKPDVFCDYKGFKIAFEVQLSNISQRYIFYRYNFYKELGIYLFWILDNFSKIHQNHKDKDIKYLNENQNVFELNENKNNPALFICNYKEPYIFGMEVREKWNKSFVDFNLHFDNDNFQVYFYDFRAQKKIIEKYCINLRLKKEQDDDEQRKFERKKELELQKLNSILKKEKQEISEIERKKTPCSGKKTLLKMI